MPPGLCRLPHLDVDEAVGSLLVEADGEDSLLIEFHLAFLWLDAALQGADWLLVVTGDVYKRQTMYFGTMYGIPA